jgi:hypothetical protein
MKGFVGGIPIALLAAAAHAMEHGTQNGQDMQTHSHYPHVGGTAIGGPSGNDEDGGFNYGGANVQTHTTVDEYSKDDHSINIKDTDVYPPPLVFGPGEGPFPKRGLYPHYGGTAIGGPSGNDEGQTFDMPIIANVQTTVDEYAKDDHSIEVKNKDIHPPPVFAPVRAPNHPPAGFGGRPSGFRETANPNEDHYHVPASAFEKRWGYEAGGTAMGGPSGGEDDNGPESGPDNDGEEPYGFNGPFVSGGTAEGGPSGDDDGVSFGNPVTANVQSNVNEYSKDDHSVHVKDTEIYPPPFSRFGAPFKRDWEPVQGATVMGGPSGNDGGQTFSAPITVDVTTGVHEHYEDDHSIDLQHEDVYAPPPFPIGGGPGPMMPQGGAPFRRAYAPERVSGGGTAMGGPSGEDGGVSFGNPTSVGVDSDVNEHSEDNHAINVDTTHVHPPPVAVPHMPWMPYHDETPIEHPGPVAVPHAETPEAAPAPPSAPVPEAHEEQPAPPSAPEEDHEEVPQCAPQVQEVVHTVTKTQYKEVHPTLTVYATPVAVPTSATPQESQAEPQVDYSAPAEHGSEFASAPAAPTSSAAAPSSYNYTPQRPMSSSASYSMISVQIPSATPSSSMMMSMATPSSSHGLPSGADALHRPSASSMPSAIMFQGSAARISGGVVSVAAAVAGVLAFVL